MTLFHFWTSPSSSVDSWLINFSHGICVWLYEAPIQSVLPVSNMCDQKDSGPRSPGLCSWPCLCPPLGSPSLSTDRVCWEPLYSQAQGTYFLESTTTQKWLHLQGRAVRGTIPDSLAKSRPWRYSHEACIWGTDPWIFSSASLSLGQWYGRELSLSVYLIFWDSVLPCIARWLWTHDPPASASLMLGLQICTTMPGRTSNINGSNCHQLYWVLTVYRSCLLNSLKIMKSPVTGIAF
jgi:hypothetical protein